MTMNHPHAQNNTAGKAQRNGCAPLRSLQRTAWFGWLDNHFNKVIVILIAIVTAFAAVIGFLETWADNHYAVSVRQGQVLAMDALRHEMSSRQRESYDFFLYTTWNEWDSRRIRAQVGQDDVLTARSDYIADIISPLTPLLDEGKPYFDSASQTADIASYHVGTNLITTTMLLEQRTFAIETANVWNKKADGFVTILTLLAVSLFLYGLSTTIKGNLRYLFAIVGTALVGVATLSALSLTLRAVPNVPSQAIAEYAQGRGLSYVGDYEGAREAFDAALQAYPNYGNAYYQRGNVNYSLQDYASAVDDYRQAIARRRSDRSTYWDLGWTLYLLGDYQSSIEANRHALEQDPDILPVALNIAIALLAQGETEAAVELYEQVLTRIAEPNSPVPDSWSQLYLRLAIQDLDRLIAALDGQTEFYEEPDLSHIGDRATLRAAAEAARLRIKEGLVSLEAAHSPKLDRTEASLSPMAFGRQVGRNGDLVGLGDTFASGARAVVAMLSYEHVPQRAIVSRRVIRHASDQPGLYEVLPTMGEDVVWSGEPQGIWQHELESPWPGERGLLSGRYVVEYYVNGYLLQTGSFTIPDDEIPTIGPIVFATQRTGGGLFHGQSSLFPAGVATVYGLFNYSGMQENSTVREEWFRDGEPYDKSSDEIGIWGDSYATLQDVPPGIYRLDLYLEEEDQLLQSAGFEVVQVDDYLQVIGTRPDESLFHRDLGDAYLYADEYEEAIAHYARATELDPNCAQCYHRWWSALYSHENYKESLEKLQQAIKLRPKEYDYLADLGLTFFKLGQDEQAVNTYRQALPANPARIYNEWGVALYKEERYAEAEVKFQQAIELNPDNEIFYRNLGDAYQEQDKYDEAIAAYKQALEIDPEYAGAYNDWKSTLNIWGNDLYRQGEYKESAEKYREALVMDPDDAVIHANLGGSYLEMGDYDLAIAEYEQAVMLDPDFDWAYNRWGDALYHQERYDEAIEKYQRATELSSDTALYYSNLGWAYFRLELYDQASTAFQQAVELDPDRASDYDMWGLALYWLGDYAGATEKHQRAVELSPDTALYHYNLAWDHYQLGETDSAVAEFELAADLAALAGNEELQQKAEEVLQELR